MSDWLHSLPLMWMALVVFGLTYLVSGAIFMAVSALAVGERARSFKAISPGLLPPLGIIFGLFVAFTAAQVWGDNERANAAVDREASALRAVVLLAASFPGEAETRLRALIRSNIDEAAESEWPMMSQGTATLTPVPRYLAEALQVTLAINTNTAGQEMARREIVTALENAFDARRQRIIVSHSEVNLAKWASLLLQGFIALVAIALVHSDNKLASSIALGLFATGIAASIFLIAAHDRPFTGQVAVGPEPLLQVMPEAQAAP
jgi:hypothetical protein